jgi:hypothetical protein
MRGHPALRVALATLVFLIMGVVVWRLTTDVAPEQIAASPVPTATSSQAPVQVGFHYTGAPARLSVSLNDQTKFEQSPSAGLSPGGGDSNWPVAIPKEGADLIVRAEWPGPPSSQALRVTLSAPGFAPAEKTFWSDAQGRIEDVISLEPSR